MSETIETIVLRDAYALLDSEQRWTSGAWARDERGDPCGPLSTRARRWCAWGALQKCAYDLIGDMRAAGEIAHRISKSLVAAPGGLVFVNERGGYDLVRFVMSGGGPPREAEPIWPSPDFRPRRGFATFARGEGCRHQTCEIHIREEALGGFAQVQSNR